MASSRLAISISKPVLSATHSTFAVDCSPLFTVNRLDSGEHELRTGRLFVPAEGEILGALSFVDSCLAALSIHADGVFGRRAWKPMSSFAGIKFLDGAPNELWGVGGITVTPGSGLTGVDSSVVRDLAAEMQRRSAEDPVFLTAVTAYAAASWFLATDLIREAGVNFFSVVELIATALRGSTQRKSVYKLSDLRKSLRRLELSAADDAIVKGGFLARGELAHGHPDDLLLVLHSMQAQPMTSFPLKLPALECKQAADVALIGYIRAV